MFSLSLSLPFLLALYFETCCCCCRHGICSVCHLLIPFRPMNASLMQHPLTPTVCNRNPCYCDAEGDRNHLPTIINTRSRMMSQEDERTTSFTTTAERHPHTPCPHSPLLLSLLDVGTNVYNSRSSFLEIAYCLKPDPACASYLFKDGQYIRV